MVVILVIVAVLFLVRPPGGWTPVGMFTNSAPGNAFIPNQGDGGTSGVAGFGAALGPIACQTVGNFYGGATGAKIASVFNKPCAAVGAQAATGAVAGIKGGVADIGQAAKATINVIRNPTDLGAHANALKTATILPAKLAINSTKTATKATINTVKSAASAVKSLFSGW